MAICVNQSGTWRTITTQCVNQAGTWRKVVTGCINQASTWRKYGMEVPPVVNISVTPTSVARSGAEGQTSTLSWSSTGATSVVSSTNFTTTATSGSLTVGPSASTTYSITMQNGAGQTSASATLTVTAPTLGSSFGGGILICRTANTNWIISTAGAEVITNWDNRGLSNTTAQSQSGCTGWFVPGYSTFPNQQLSNPGFVCRVYWSPTNAPYWTNEPDVLTNFAYAVNPATNQYLLCGKATNLRIRSMRTVTF